VQIGAPVVVLTVVLAVVIGVVLGLLGGGGSILTVPLLVYVAGMPTREAIATSLLVVAVTATAAAVPHARAGNVRWGIGLRFGAAGMVGAYLGGLAGTVVPEVLLLTAFGVLMAVTAVAMLRKGARDGSEPVPAPRARPARIVLDGLVVGLVTGLVGAGGGFLVVPALVLLGGLGMRAAIGTSLVVVAMKSFAGLAGYLTAVELDLRLAGAVTLAAVAGSVLGGLLTTRTSPELLRDGFAWFVAAMAVFVVGQQLPLAVPALVWLLLGTAGALVGALLVHRAGRAERGGDPSPRGDLVHHRVHH